MKLAQSTKTLSPYILQWVSDTVGSETTIHSVHPLGGATSSTLYRLEMEHQQRRPKLVLRLFTNEGWLKEEPDLVQHEASSLEKVQAIDVPTPELVACDESGEICGTPAILMTHLPGSVDLKPVKLDDWLLQMAKALIPLHSLDTAGHPWRYTPYNDVARLEPPAWSSQPELWAKAIERVQGPWPDVPECFIHRDYHPNNVLWQHSRLSGIIDWPNACIGPAGIDVAWCRGNLIHLYGVDVAERFLRAYESLAGTAFSYHPMWDWLVIIETLPGPPEVYPPWLEFGIQHVSRKVMRERLDEYLASVMARF